MSDKDFKSLTFIEFLAFHAALGFFAGVAVGAVAVLTNTFDLRDLIIAIDQPYVAVFFFLANSGATGAMVKVAYAVMTMGEDTGER